MPTKRLMIDELKDGMILAEPVVVGAHIVQDKGELLTSKTLEQLKTDTKVLSVNIYIPDSSIISVDTIKEQLLREHAKAEPEQKSKSEDTDLSDFSFGKRKVEDYSYEEKKVVVEKYVGTVSYVKNVFDMATQFNDINIDDVMTVAKDSIDNLMDNYMLVHAVKNLRGSDDYTYQHSINVGILSGIIGRWLKMDEEQIPILVLSGIMHDIGKSQIPLSILNKPDKLTPQEFEIMKQHTVIGYKILKTIKNVPEQVPLVALEHHERIDGSGYPKGVTAEKIHDFSKIIAVADTYDAVTTDRVYQPKRAPMAVMEILDNEMFSKMDARSCLSMLVQIRDSLENKRVILKNGDSATIVFVGKHGSDELVVKTDSGKTINIGKTNYHREISKYIG